MKVFLTGAGGFLGRAVATAAAEAGHIVLGLQRPASLRDRQGQPEGVQAVAGDLRQSGEWAEALAGADAVIHCAAAASGDLPTQLQGTVLATENLLAALPPGLQRFVHVSSLSVYDFDAPGWRGALDEQTPLERDPVRRDAYTATKLQQERMVRRYCADRGVPLVVVRPGAIYGQGKDWDFGRVGRIGPFDLIFAPLSRMRLVHVRDCARAIVAAIEPSAADGPLTVNLVDDHQPTHWGFHRMARRAGAPAGIGVPVPYWTVRGLGLAARLASRLFFAGRAKLPEFLDPPRQRVRWRNLRYPNAWAKEALAWRPTIPLEDGVTDLVRSSGGQDGDPDQRQA